MPYPFLITDNFLGNDDIQAINEEHNYLFDSGIETWAGGQESRENIVITNQNNFFKKVSNSCPNIEKLFKTLDSADFRGYLFETFREYLHSNAFIGKQADAFLNSTLELQLCRSVDGYENPIHVDTRKRIVHALVYLNHKDLSGGEFDIVEHKKRDKSWDYPQYPDTGEIKNIYRYSPNNNRSIFILSTPNSYHRGVKAKGMRNFLYIGFNYSEPAWNAHSSWNDPKPFKSSLLKQEASQLNQPLPKCRIMDSLNGESKRSRAYKVVKPVKSESIGSVKFLIQGLASQ